MECQNMKRTIQIPNRIISQLVDEHGVIDALKKLKCNERLSFIDEAAMIGEGTEIGYYCIINNCKIGQNVKIYNQCNLYGCEIGDGTQIASQVEVQSNAKIGKNCKIGQGSFIPEGSIIGDGVFLGPKTVLCNDKFPKATNGGGRLKTKSDWKLEPVVIEDGVSLGACCTILPGIKIEKNSLVGASSVVTHNIPKNETWFGQPAKPQIKDEEWRDVFEFEDLYMISNYGRIISKHNDDSGILLRLSKDTNNYERVVLFNDRGEKKHISVHRLVALGFIPNPENKPFVNHKNGIKWDNRSSNLEWVTQSENVVHAYKTGLAKVIKGKDHHNYGKFGKDARSSKPILQLDYNTNEIIAEFESIEAAAKLFNCSATSIGHAARGRGQSSMGFKWKFKENN